MLHDVGGEPRAREQATALHVALWGISRHQPFGTHFNIFRLISHPLWWWAGQGEPKRDERG
jgi:hypothetical protein